MKYNLKKIISNMAAKKYMTSYYVLYACFCNHRIVFAAFFGYGYDNP